MRLLTHFERCQKIPNNFHKLYFFFILYPTLLHMRTSTLVLKSDFSSITAGRLTFSTRLAKIFVGSKESK